MVNVRKMVIFLAKVCTLYILFILLWDSYYTFPLYEEVMGYIVHYTLKLIMHTCIFAFNILGYDAVEAGWKVILLKNINTTITIVDRCLGIEIMACFAILVIAYPASFRSKIWFLPLGISGILLINIIRILLIGIMLVKYVAFETHFLFNLVAYFFIFLIYILWVNQIRKKAEYKT